MQLKEQVLYKYVYDNEIIYIGKSKTSIKSRVQKHSKEDKFHPFLKKVHIYVWFSEMESYQNRTSEIDLLERALIIKYKPVLNVQYKDTSLSESFTINDLFWITYDEYLFQKEQKAKAKKQKKIMENKIIYFESQIAFYENVLQAIHEDKEKIILPEHCCMSIEIPTGFTSKSKAKTKSICLLDLSKPMNTDNMEFYIDKNEVLENKNGIDVAIEKKKNEIERFKIELSKMGCL